MTEDERKLLLMLTSAVRGIYERNHPGKPQAIEQELARLADVVRRQTPE